MSDKELNDAVEALVRLVGKSGVLLMAKEENERSVGRLAEKLHSLEFPCVLELRGRQYRVHLLVPDEFYPITKGGVTSRANELNSRCTEEDARYIAEHEADVAEAFRDRVGFLFADLYESPRGFLVFFWTKVRGGAGSGSKATFFPPVSHGLARLTSSFSKERGLGSRPHRVSCRSSPYPRVRPCRHGALLFKHYS